MGEFRKEVNQKINVKQIIFSVFFKKYKIM